jgi:hypothetical protein
MAESTAVIVSPICETEEAREMFEPKTQTAALQYERHAIPRHRSLCHDHESLTYTMCLTCFISLLTFRDDNTEFLSVRGCASA